MKPNQLLLQMIRISVEMRNLISRYMFIYSYSYQFIIRLQFPLANLACINSIKVIIFIISNTTRCDYIYFYFQFVFDCYRSPLMVFLFSIFCTFIRKYFWVIFYD